jgi:hypothetical protein
MPAAKPCPTWLFWLLASTFLWGFLVAPIGLNEVIGSRKWPTLLGYSTVCWTAAVFLARAGRTGAVAFAVFHLILGLAWIPFAHWVIQGFGRIWK